MADVQPLRALRHDLERAGPLARLISPPYDVLDAQQRADLAARSPYNAVHLDLPQAPEPDGDPYLHAALLLDGWRDQGAVVQDDEPSLLVLEQEFDAPGGGRRTRRGVHARVRVQPYGPGGVRPHERTHPGPKEDRLRLTRATKANVSPIFVLHDDPEGTVTDALQRAIDATPLYASATDDEGTEQRLHRITDPDLLAAVCAPFADRELLIADGHHRYETARVYADEQGAQDGPHRFVLAHLVALQDPGLAVFPTHRLLDDLKDPVTQERLGTALKELFDVTPLHSTDELRPPDGQGPLTLGYLDRHFNQPFRLVLKDQARADAALRDKPAAFRHLDTAVLEALVLRDVLGMTEDDVAHLNGLGYSRTDREAVELITSGRYDCGFFLRASPVEQVREVAATGEVMPPKSTFFHPKVPSGLTFNPLAYSRA
ncbi:DUF1015 domain-containing protein [Conexibacter sp. SYSU D00693]|uniref:DUF1015 domain-containing protein n=1 Tax=Conexibacter sp. SYSU D00693 TaxID=2812560 RepID=UPI00196B50B9|nr:DUF1015 domain-containing protein [Conexibacter sp. SYSU D00693]